ncbi:MAG: hypothetical protein QNJ47_19935 [Nostocaceae cyanobacterium]|nr:hypothetical protein [Nostocaceae cyanobacterium]
MSQNNSLSIHYLEVEPHTQLVTVDDPSPTISVLWDQAVQQAVINTAVGPTIASRAYAIVHTAIFDAWAVYDPEAIATQLGDELQRPESEITEANKEEAMSFAAYRVLTELFPDQVNVFNELMVELGFDPNNTTTDKTTPAGIGNISAQTLLEFRREDGSNQQGYDPNGTIGVPYSDMSDYQPVNPPGNPVDIEYWTPEIVPIDAEPGEGTSIQKFLTPHWGNVTPFALESGDQFRPEAPKPFLLVEGEVDLEEKTITLKDTGEILPITRDLIGDLINPEFIEQTEKIIHASANLTDEHKLIAEFWEDAAGTSFPPGTWMTFGEFVSARDDNTLDQDAQLFFTLGNAVFDAGIATWEAKTFYDYNRPLRAVRELGELGLIGEFNQDLGGFTIEAWAGPEQGTQTILATDFLTYQTPGSDPSPPFAEYTSGHSAFSAAGAEILRLFTGSDDFGAGVSFQPGESRFEPNFTPQETVTLKWETFSEAADEAGISRIYGGIHFDDGDVNGRQLGREVAQTVWEQAQFFIQGGEEPQDPDATIFGTAEDDIFDLGNGDDTIYGNGGEDTLLGDDGNNLVFGGSQADTIMTGDGDDTIYANGGGDYINTGAGFDTVWLGSGLATVVLDIGEGYDAIKNFQLGATKLKVGSVDNLSFDNSTEGTQIFQGDDLLAVVSWQNASTFYKDMNDIFVA